MAKERVKRSIVEAEAVEYAPGRYRFSVGGFAWFWEDKPGLNLMIGGQVSEKDSFRVVMHADTLQSAIYYARGFDAGRLTQLAGLDAVPEGEG